MKPKILFLLHIPPPVHGSSLIGLYIKDSKLINESFDCQYINFGISKSIEEIGKNGIIKILRYLFIIWQVFKQLIFFRPQLCYIAITAKGAAFYKDSLIVILNKLFRVRVIFHFHNKGVSSRQHLFIDNLLYSFIFKNADVILLSDYLFSDIKKYVPENRVHYCPNGIPEKVQSSKFKIQNSETVQILFLSNLIESKGVFVLLDACKILQNKHLKFHCTFVGGIGDVSEQQFDSKVHYLGIETFVSYVGKKYGEEKESELLKADIFAFPTYYHNECFPLVILEAMQHHLPVVSTFEGGILDIVKNNISGFIVKQRDVNNLAEKLEILIRNPLLRQKMGKAGFNHYQQEFTLAIFEKNLTKILYSVVNEKIT
jgi:glycosyltransferase involved in cell wall biosynthesis